MSCPLVRVEDVSFAYRGNADSARLVLRNITLAIQPGELVAVIGQNGSGKTTLARHLNGLLRPTSGRVVVGDLDTRAAPVGELARRVGYVFQNPDHQLFLPTVRAEIAYGPERLGLTGAMLSKRVSETLERFDLSGLADHHPAVLGRGLRRLTALAAVYAMGPRVLVLDEPTGGLDRRLAANLMRILRDVIAEAHAVVLITHDMRLVAEHADRVVALLEGTVIADTSPACLFTQAELLATTNLQPPVATQLAAALQIYGMPQEILTIDGFCEEYARLAEERHR